MDPFDQRLAQLDVDIEAVHQRAAAATAFRQGTEKVRGRSSVDGIEVISANEKDDTANVELEVKFKDGSKRSERVKLKKVNGDWKIRL